MADASSANTNSGKITDQSEEESEEERQDQLGMAILVYENEPQGWGLGYQNPSQWREDAGEAKQEDREEGGSSSG